MTETWTYWWNTSNLGAIEPVNMPTQHLWLYSFWKCMGIPARFPELFMFRCREVKGQFWLIEKTARNRRKIEGPAMESHSKLKSTKCKCKQARLTPSTYSCALWTSHRVEWCPCAGRLALDIKVAVPVTDFTSHPTHSRHAAPRKWPL